MLHPTDMFYFTKLIEIKKIKLCDAADEKDVTLFSPSSFYLKIVVVDDVHHLLVLMGFLQLFAFPTLAQVAQFPLDVLLCLARCPSIPSATKDKSKTISYKCLNSESQTCFITVYGCTLQTGVLFPALIGSMMDRSSLAAIRRDRETREEPAWEERGGTEASTSLRSCK